MSTKKGLLRAVKEWPLLQGSVSIMAHSLGSVLSYDVLCNQPHLYAGLHLPQPPAHSPEAVQQSKRARLGSADTQVPVFPPSLCIPNIQVTQLLYVGCILAVCRLLVGPPSPT